MGEEKKQAGDKLVKVLSQALLPLNEETVRTYICAKATRQEIALFLNVCQISQLNPFKREVYLVKYSDKDPANIVTAYDVYLKRAHRSNNWLGLKEGVIKDKDGTILYGWAEVYRKDWGKDFPLHHEVKFSEYAQYKDEWKYDRESKQNEKTGKKVLTKFWGEKPETMIKKVAIEQAFRMAFPDEFDGMPYAAEELGVDTDKAPVIDIVVESAKKYPDAQKAEVHAPEPVKDEFSEGEPPAQTPGGKAISEKISELARLQPALSRDTIHTAVQNEIQRDFGRLFAEYNELDDKEVAAVLVYLDKWLALSAPKTEKKGAAK